MITRRRLAPSDQTPGEVLGHIVSTRAKRLALVAIWAGPLAFLGWAAPAEAAGTGGVGAGPAPGAPGVLAGGGYFAPTVAPGSTWTSELLVANDSATTAPIEIYGADGLTAGASGAVYSNFGQPLRATGMWVSPKSRTVTIPPEGQATVRFSVSVPRSASPGDHLAGIVAQSASPSTSGSGHLRVTVVARAVVGVLVRVPGPATFSVGVGAPTVGRGPDGVGEVVTPLTDSGRLIGKPTIDVSLSGPGGYKSSVTSQVDTLLPGGTARFPVYWPDSLHGTYRIKSCVSWPGSAKPRCRSATVAVNDTTKTVKDLHAKSVRHNLPSWVVVLISACGGAVVMGVVLKLRRPTPVHSARRRRRRAGSDPKFGIDPESRIPAPTKADSVSGPGTR